MNQKIREIVTNDPVFQCTFMNWLEDKVNYKLWLAFKRQAAAWRVDDSSGSARLIVENLRRYSRYKDSSKQFKIDGCVVPDLARLFNKLTNTEFFNERKGVRR